MLNQKPSIGVVILAAGDGKRMNSELPKVMHLLHGIPLISHVVDHAMQTGICEKPVVVVSPKHVLVQECLQDRANYVIQKEQLGTGHAVSVAETLLQGKSEHIVVLYGDMPFVSTRSIQQIALRHLERQNTMTMMTATVPNFDGDYSSFYSFGRVVRRKSDGHIAGIVEKKDASEEELLVREVNPSVFCFESVWLWEHIHLIQSNNAQKEYYLTDLAKMCIDEGKNISSIPLDPKEALGINSQDDLQLAQTITL